MSEPQDPTLTSTPAPAKRSNTTSSASNSISDSASFYSVSPSLNQLVARLTKPDYGNDSSSEEEDQGEEEEASLGDPGREDEEPSKCTNSSAMGSHTHRRGGSLTPSEMVPLTTVETNNHHQNCSDLELGYEEDPTDHHHENHNAYHLHEENKGSGGEQILATDEGEGMDLVEETEEHEEDESIWEKIPIGLALSAVVFTLTFLVSLRMVVLYLSQNHGGIYTCICSLLITVGFALPAYIVANTIWFSHLELEHILERQDKARDLLSNVYPEHILQRLLPEEDCSEHHGELPQPDDMLLPTMLSSTDASTVDGCSVKILQQQQQQQQQDEYYSETSHQDQLPSSTSKLSNAFSKFNDAMHMPISQAIHTDDHSHNNTKNLLGCTTLCTPEKHSRICTHHPKTIGTSIIDLFANTTVFYAEIVGFTAWSSTRAPRQVFDLLQSVFCQLDQQAKQGGVFKVESMADSYIAVTGLPDPDPQHAVRMAQFASDCLTVFLETCQRLERTLGPDTGELQLRIGLHSGPVTAGVLQGDKGRFQLFGNTVNNAVLVEKQGRGNCVHISRETAELLEAAEKQHWIEAREKSQAGNTYWLTAAQEGKRRNSCSHGAAVPIEDDYFDVIEEVDMESVGTGTGSQDYYDDNMSQISQDNMSQFSQDTGVSSAMSTGSSDSKKNWTMQDILTAKEQRLIEWTVDQLALMLQKIVARRNAMQRVEERAGRRSTGDDGQPPPFLHYTPNDHNQTVLDEVKEMIVVPSYKTAVLLDDALEDPETVELPDRVLEELTNYVSTVTTFYYSPDRNPFHNFMHASHVLMSVVKMLERIISPSQMALEKDRKKSKKNRRRKKKKDLSRSTSWTQLHDHTFGITTDPLTQFAVVFAALIHDLDHPGVPNAQLVKEESRLARIYKNRSISEQNSLDMAWDLLMDPSYQTLVRTICGNQDELKRFRQLLVQTVMATDIADAELRAARNARWDMAFAKKTDEKKDGEDESENDIDLLDDSNHSLGAKRETEQETEDDKNRKATIVLEHLLQASDIAHTMQHWEVFRKWNEKLYREMYLAYLHGRAEKDPVEFWYKGEIGFFKFYIIPLAKKLSDCGVFGVSSDEYLNYAEQNLQLWETRGAEVVKEVSERAYRDFGRKEDHVAE